MTAAYPLQWPEGFPRAKARETGKFKTTLAGALKNVRTSLDLFSKDSGKRVEFIVLSSNVTLGAERPTDPGVAVWFTWDGLQLCIPDLLATPAALRWVSIEPMLGAVDLGKATGLPVYWEGTGMIELTSWGKPIGSRPGLGWVKHSGNMQAWLDWVVCGGESGPHARPMHPSWARSLRDQCKAAGVPFHFKQWGEWAPVDEPASEIQEDRELRGTGACFDGAHFHRVGKARAGHLLDGVEHREFPEARNG